MEQTKTHFWTDDEENILADIALQYLRDGKNLKEAMEEVSLRLNRSVHSINHRWTNFVKKDYDQEIKIAKKIGEKVKGNIEESKTLAMNINKNIPKQATIEKDKKPSEQNLKSMDFILLLKTHIQEYTDLVNNQDNFNKLMEEKELELNNAYLKIADLESKMTNSISGNALEEIKKLRDANSKLEKQVRLAQPLLKAAIELDAFLETEG